MRRAFLLTRHCKESNELVKQRQLKSNFEKSSFFIDYFSYDFFLKDSFESN
jgi:hypothetical protein